MIGVGMPAYMKLDLFGKLVRDAFPPAVPYLVGSALESKQWRDVDVRLILDEDEWARYIGEPYRGSLPLGSRRMSFELAFSELGRAMTGLPIDFQIQPQKDANERYPGRRQPLGIELTR